MRHLALVLGVWVVLAACPREAKQPPAEPVVQDTTPVDLDSVRSAIPAAVPDTFTAVAARPVRSPRVPPAPAALLEAVEREQSFSRFCYQEFGQKADPTLAGGVAMVVTVEASGIREAHVESDTWSSPAGKAVNDCLNEKAAKAWKPAAGSVRPGRYRVQLSFRPS